MWGRGIPRTRGWRGRAPGHERKDKNRENAANFYRASHVEVFLPPSDIVGTYTNVADVPCEEEILPHHLDAAPTHLVGDLGMVEEEARAEGRALG